MPNTIEPGGQQGERPPVWRTPPFMTLVMLANAAAVVGLLQMLPLSQCALLVIGGAALAAGVLYMTPALFD